MTEKELEEKEKILQKMEEDIKEKCSQIDKDEANLLKKQKELDKTLGLTKDSDLFMQFYENVNSIYTLWCSSKGSREGLIESIQKILDARHSIQRDESEPPVQ